MRPHIDANWTDRERGKQEGYEEEEEEEDKRGEGGDGFAVPRMRARR